MRVYEDVCCPGCLYLELTLFVIICVFAAVYATPRGLAEAAPRAVAPMTAAVPAVVSATRRRGSVAVWSLGSVTPAKRVSALLCGCVQSTEFLFDAVLSVRDDVVVNRCVILIVFLKHMSLSSFTESCLGNCNYRGKCDNGTCVCGDWWTGAKCEVPRCKNNCSSQGACVLPRIELLRSASSPASTFDTTAAVCAYLVIVRAHVHLS